MRVVFVLLPILSIGLVVFVGIAIAMIGDGGATLGYLAYLVAVMVAAWMAPESAHRWILGIKPSRRCQ